MTIFEQPELMMQLLTCQIFAMFLCSGDDIQDFGTRWDQALLTASFQGKCSGECVQVEDTIFCAPSNRISALHEQKIDRDRELPSYQRLKTLVRRHID